MTEDEEKCIREDITHLRETGGRDNLAAADRLESRLIVLKRQTERIEQLTVDRLQEWVAELRAALGSKRLDDLASWPAVLRGEMFQALQLAWAASRFRTGETAKLLGVDRHLVAEWLDSDWFSAWSVDAGPRSMRVIAVADLALSRMGHILSIETNDPGMLSLQQKTASTVLTAGVTLPSRTPRGPEEPAKKRALPAEGNAPPAPPKRKRVVK